MNKLIYCDIVIYINKFYSMPLTKVIVKISQKENLVFPLYMLYGLIQKTDKY